MKEYPLLVLTPGGHILDQHTLTCADDDVARATAVLFADNNPVEI
jgi:hypothetical protein